MWRDFRFTREVLDLLLREAVVGRCQQVKGSQRLADRHGTTAMPVAYAVIDVNRHTARTLQVRETKMTVEWPLASPVTVQHKSAARFDNVARKLRLVKEI
jgi:hypothetical protein